MQSHVLPWTSGFLPWLVVTAILWILMAAVRPALTWYHRYMGSKPRAGLVPPLAQEPMANGFHWQPEGIRFPQPTFAAHWSHHVNCGMTRIYLTSLPSSILQFFSILIQCNKMYQYNTVNAKEWPHLAPRLVLEDALFYIRLSSMHHGPSPSVSSLLPMGRPPRDAVLKEYGEMREYYEKFLAIFSGAVFLSFFLLFFSFLSRVLWLTVAESGDSFFPKMLK